MNRLQWYADMLGKHEGMRPVLLAAVLVCQLSIKAVKFRLI